LKLEYDEPLSKNAFKFNLRRCTEEPANASGLELPAASAVGAVGAVGASAPDPVGADGRVDVSRLPFARQVRTPHNTHPQSSPRLFHPAQSS